MPVVSSGEATSYNSDSKQTIPGPVEHRPEIEWAVALPTELPSRNLASILHRVSGFSLCRNPVAGQGRENSLEASDHPIKPVS